jgi:hypothetical protein
MKNKKKNNINIHNRLNNEIDLGILILSCTAVVTLIVILAVIPR